ncbi:MAG: putative quinol monooxygenase [Acidimicrobiales bacterium]
MRFELLRGHESAFDELVAETVERIQQEEPGTFAYLVHAMRDEPGGRAFVEIYENEAAFERHEREPHTRRFLAERGQYLRQEPEVWFISPEAGFVRDGIVMDRW